MRQHHNCFPSLMIDTNHVSLGSISTTLQSSSKLKVTLHDYLPFCVTTNHFYSYLLLAHYLRMNYPVGVPQDLNYPSHIPKDVNHFNPLLG